MRIAPQAWRVALGVASTAALVATVLAALPAAPVVPPGLDLLELPGPQTRQGQRKLLLDVARAGKRLVAVGELGLIIWSDDAGAHWQQAASPTSVMLTALHFVDAQQGWAVGHDGVILASTDAGLHWQRQFDGRQANAQVLAATQAQFDQAQATKGQDDQSRQLREQAEDRLADAEAAMQMGPSRPFLGVHFVTRDTGFAVGAFGQLFQTTDAGRQWHYIGDRLRNGEGLHLNSISAAPDGNLFIAAEAGTVFRSADLGRTWLRTQVDYNGQLFGVLSVQSEGRAVHIAYGFGGHLFASGDSGAHWAPLASPFKHTIVSASLLDEARFVMAAQDGQLAVGTQGGAHFEVLPGRSPLRKTTGLTLLPAQNAVLAVGLGGVSNPPLALPGAKP